MTGCYLSRIPYAGVRILAGFPAQRGLYYLPRADIDPPTEIVEKIFPQAVEWEKRLEDALDCEEDLAGQGFCKLLLLLRKVLVQDMACLQPMYPNLPLFQHPIFNNQLFLDYSQQVINHIKTAEDPMEVRIASVLPELSSVLEGLKQSHNSTATSLQTSLQNLNQDVNKRLDLITSHLNSKNQETTMTITLNPSSSEIVNVSHNSNPDSSSSSSIPPPISSNPNIDLNVPHTTPKYKLSRGLTTVPHVWQEWFSGINGGPSIHSLLTKYKTSSQWRAPGEGEKKLFLRRSKIIKEIQRMASAEGISTSDAILSLETARQNEKRSLDWMGKHNGKVN